MSSGRVVPAEALSTTVTGSRAPLWWGMLLLIVIETTVFASLVSSYFYLRLGAPQWPPDGIEPPKLLLPTINTVILLASSATMRWADNSVSRDDQRGLRFGLILSVALATTFLAIKAIEYSDQSYTWSTNAYGSIVWTITGFHSGHVIALVLKTVVVGALAWRGYFTSQRRLGVTVNGLYWHFVVAVWPPLYAVLYLSPYVL